MLVIENVTGSKAQAQPLIVGATTVYVHENLQKVEGEEELYTYREIQYDKNEYIALISTENAQIKDALNSVLTEIIPSLVPTAEGGGE